jgi:hypothetical protein
MNRAEALTRLGLDFDATPAEIDRAWRSAMKRVHPDSGSDPEPALVAALNEARQVALAAAASTATALVPRDSAYELVRSDPTLAMHAATSERALRTVVMHHVGHLAYQRRQRTILAGLTGGGAALLALIGALTRFDPYVVPPSLVLSMSALLATVSALFGVLAWRTAAIERRLQLELDEVAETLSDRAALADTLTELGLQSFFTRGELHAAISHWAAGVHVARRDRGPTVASSVREVLLPVGARYRSVPLAHTAAVIGAVDFAKLLIAKGVELGMLIEDERVTGNGEVYGYTRMPARVESSRSAGPSARRPGEE